MQACCVNHAEVVFKGLLEKKEGVPSELQVFVNRILKDHSLFAKYIRMYAEVRVAILKKYVTAQATIYRCSNCEGDSTLIILSAPLLLLIWRISMLFMRGINKWELNDKKLIVDFKSVDGALKSEFKEMIDEYLNGGERSFLTLSHEIEKVKEVPKVCLEDFHYADVFANLWVMGHEVAHTISEDKLSQVTSELLEIRKATAKFVDLYDLYPSVAHEWEEELNADLIALLLLYLTEAKRLKVDLEDVLVRETIASKIAGGVALACEAMYHIVRNVYPENTKDLNELKHPPLEIRWQVVKSYLMQISRPRANVSIFYFADVISRISFSFTDQ